MAGMEFRYPARLERVGEGEVVVSFRDLPECLTSAADEAGALAAAVDALEEAVAGRIDDGEPVPAPSRRRPGERSVSVPVATAAKAALAAAFRDSGLSRVRFAARLGIDEKAVRRMLDPRHRTAGNAIDKALLSLGRQAAVRVNVA